MDCYEQLTAIDYDWLKEYSKEGPEDEEWWEFNQLERSLETWSEDFGREEREWIEHEIFNAYVFAEDILGKKGPDYHIALFRQDSEGAREEFLSLDDFREVPIVTIGKLDLILRSISDRYLQTLFYRINEVPAMFSKNKNYRSLYWFEAFNVVN